MGISLKHKASFPAQGAFSAFSIWLKALDYSGTRLIWTPKGRAIVSVLSGLSEKTSGAHVLSI